jgi:2-dehydro-3-deoxygluconokinase
MHVKWFSALPANPQGQHVASELRRHGIDTSHIVWTDSSERLGIFYAEEASAPLGIQVYYDRANSACALVNPDLVDYSVVDDARMLHLTGITPALSPQAHSVFQRLLQRAHEHNVPLAFDVNYRGKLWSAQAAAQTLAAACQQASVLFCARADAVELWSCSGSAEQILRQLAQRFTLAGQSKTLVLTLGKEGSAQLAHGEYSEEPSIPTESTSRFGSGDAFDAGYLYAYLYGPHYTTLQQAEPHVTPLAFGNALAALKRCIAGDIAEITPDEVKMLLQKESSRFR